MPYIDEHDKNIYRPGWSSNMDDPDAIRFANIQYSSPYISNLRNRIGYYTGWITEDFADQVTADDAWDLITDDAQVAHAMDLLSLWSAGEYVEVHANNTEIKFITTKALSYIQDFTHARKSLIYHGTLFGLGLHKITWQKVRFREYPDLVWEVPVRLDEVDRQRLRIERSVHTDRKAWWTLWDYEYDQYLVLADGNQWPGYKGPKLQDFVWYYWENEEKSPYYRGKGLVLYRLLYIKDKLLKYWAALAENWSQPYVIFAINTMKELMTRGGNAQVGLATLQERLDDIVEKYRKQVAGHVMVVDKDATSIEFKEHGTQGNNIISEFIGYIDGKINNYILAAELTTQTGSSHGSYAQAKVHRGATQTKVLYGRHRAEERFTQDLVYNFYQINYLNLVNLGLRLPDPGEVNLLFKVRSEEVKEKILLAPGTDRSKASKEKALDE